MIYLILVFAIFTLLAQSKEVQKYMTPKENDVFQKRQENIPEYNVVPIKHLVHQRSTGIVIEAEINGTDKRLYLKRNKGIFASKSTKVYTAKIDPEDRTKFVYSAHSGVMEKVGTFYQEKKTLSSFSHKLDEDGKSMFNGVSGDYVIRPISSHLRRRRDLWSGNYSIHRYENNETFRNAVDHIIYKRDVGIDENLKGLNISENISFLPQTSRKSKSGNPHVIYPEIILFIDDILFRKFDRNIEKTVTYILAFWNAVDLRYREFKAPKIFLNIARIVLIEGPLPFERLVFPFYSVFSMFAEMALHSFGEYLYNEDKIEFKKDYDIAMLMTGKSLLLMDNETKVDGISFTNGACNKTIAGDKIKSIGVISDDGSFQSIRTATHELAHIIGAPHDGNSETSVGGPGARNCSEKDGYMMSYERINSNCFHFSSCSQQSIAYFTSLEQAECLRNNPSEGMTMEEMPKILPGKLMTLDEQCEAAGYYGARYRNATVCIHLFCLVTPIGSEGDITYTAGSSAAEGSYCGDGMHCLNGECVKEEPEID